MKSLNVGCPDLSDAPRLFMEEFHQQTIAHPFMPKSHRVWRGVVVFDIYVFGDSICLAFIQSLKKGVGFGHDGLKFLCNLADKHGVSVRGDVQRVGKFGLTTAQLKAWYKRNGFSVDTCNRLHRNSVSQNKS